MWVHWKKLVPILSLVFSEFISPTHNHRQGYLESTRGGGWGNTQKYQQVLLLLLLSLLGMLTDSVPDRFSSWLLTPNFALLSLSLISGLDYVKGSIFSGKGSSPFCCKIQLAPIQLAPHSAAGLAHETTTVFPLGLSSLTLLIYCAGIIIGRSTCQHKFLKNNYSWSA